MALKPIVDHACPMLNKGVISILILKIEEICPKAFKVNFPENFLYCIKNIVCYDKFTQKKFVEIDFWFGISLKSQQILFVAL